MRIDRLQIANFRSFAVAQSIEMGAITILIGPNNAGKSSVLRALYLLQDHPEFGRDIRIGTPESDIRLSLSEIRTPTTWPDIDHDRGELAIKVTRNQIELAFAAPDGSSVSALGRFPPRDPDHYVVPFFSRRKATLYQEDVREELARSVQGDFGNLAAKLSRLGNPSYPAHEMYDRTCRAILGFTVTAIPSANGQRPGIYLPNRETLPLDQMGEGVPNIAALLADLAESEGKLFLVEEPENDLHPKALKSLLDLVVESSSRNQVVVSTHSNIVARHLGAAPDSRLYSVSLSPGVMPPETVIEPVGPSPEARLRVLRDLGYEFSDLDLWEGWLILEEASSERIIRDYLIRWFAPRLTRVRTFAAGGNTKVAPAFEDFNRLVLFANLDEAYRNSVWVLIDGDEEGREVIERLRERFPKWEGDRFDCFESETFESYYPAHFASGVERVLAIAQKQERRRAKRDLLAAVIVWLDEDDERGRAALAESADGVIVHLRRIEAQLFGPNPGAL